MRKYKYKIGDVIILTKNPMNWESVEVGKKYTIIKISTFYELKGKEAKSYHYEILEDISFNINELRTEKLERILK